MIESQTKNEKRLEELQEVLSKASSIQQTIAALQQAKKLLQTLTIQEISNIKEFMIKHLKPISRQVTNISLKQASLAKEDLQDLLLIIFRLYVDAARYKLEVSAFQIISQLLARSTELFVKSQNDQTPIDGYLQKRNQLQIQWEWVMMKSLSFQKNTFFFYKCVNAIMENMSGIEAVFTTSGFNFIKQYIYFSVKMTPYLKISKILMLCERTVTALQNIMISAASSNNKQLIKQLTLQSIRSLSAAGVKLADQYRKYDFKKRFQMLASLYGLSLLGMNSIEKKINGLKIINKEAQQFYRSSQTSVKQQDYGVWILDNKIIQMILQQAIHSPILKNCNYIFRILFRKRSIGRQIFVKILNFIQDTNTENRQLLLKYIQYESLRFQYSDYETFLQKLKGTHKPDFFQEDTFTLCIQFTRYSSSRMIKQYLEVLQSILKANFGKFKNEKVQHRCLKSYVRSAISLFERETLHENKKKQLLKIYDSFIGEQFNQLGILVFKNLIEQLPETSDFSKSNTVMFLMQTKKPIEKGLIYMQKCKQNACLKEDIENFINLLLKCTQDYYGEQKVQFSPEILLQSVHSPSIFSKLTSFIPYSQKMLNVFQQLLTKFNMQSFPFDCLKYIFYRINYSNIRQVKNYGHETQHQVKCQVQNLKGIQSLKYLMLNANIESNRDKIADFLSDLYTHYDQERTREGEAQLQKIMKETLQLTLDEYKSQHSSPKLLGYLAFVQQLMMATEILGTGKYKPHNSLVPVSTVQIKINNDITYGNDVSQSYEKKVPANLTLFELLSELGEKFRCPACQITLQQTHFEWPQKWNGLTLQELKIDGKVLKAVKSPKDKIRKQILLQNNELTPKARKVFEQIYNIYAIDGKMGKKQCSNFVAGVTKTSSSPYQGRVIQFFKEFDLDQDDNITVEDFLRFYKQNCSPSRDDVVWKNLNNMRYRKDLKKYHDPVELTHENLLFRALIYKSNEFYNILFAQSQSLNAQLQTRCKRLLLRLPTFPKTVQSVHSQLNLIEKNCFQTEYLLIAIQSKLNSGASEQKDQNRKLFIQSKNSHQIFQMMIRIDKMTNATQNQRKCLIISLQILRSLVKVPDLRNNIQIFDHLQFNLKLPETDLFNKLAKNSLQNMEIQIFQSSIVLQFTQQNNLIQLALEGIFHQQVGIRKICCNYIFILYINHQVKLDLFQIQQKANCQFWFETLAKICSFDKKIDFSQVIKKSLEILKTRKQTIQKIPEDPIIFGNLNIIQSILKEQGAYKFKDFSGQIVDISQNVISGKSRQLIYSILACFDINYAITFLINLIDSVKPMKQIEHKKFYVGLKNLGNTCYMNSALQVLFFCDDFKNLVMNLPKKQLQISEANGKKIYDDTLYQLQKMYSYLTKSIKKYYNPQQFCFTFKKPGTNQPIDTKLQQDAHEFVGKFLDKIQKNIQNPEIVESLKQLLQGKTVTQIQCKTCLNKINRQQTFCQLPLSVQKLTKLEQSLASYIFPEQILEYYCEKCEKKVQKISKATFLSKLPKFLIINLQRIIYDLEQLLQKKIDTTFEFPQDLNVFDYVLKDANLTAQQCNYKLKSVIIHSGTSESGHYYSIIKVGNQWFKFNDQTVTKFDIKNLSHQAFGGSQSKQQWSDQFKFSTNAYILFYEKQDQKQLEPEFKLEEQVIQQILTDNQKFYKQLQVHQQSIFIFADELFQKYQPADIQQKMKIKPYEEAWNLDPNVQYYQSIYSLSLKIFQFATSFYDVKSNLIFKIGQNLFKMFYLLPQKSYSFITEMSPDECIQNLCLHPDDTIRNVSKYLMNKSMHVFNCYYQLNFESEQPGVAHFIKLLDCLFAFLQDQRLMKNMAKSYFYFQFWKTNCQYIPPIVQYLAQHEMMAILGDLLMGNDSPLADKKKKRTQIPQIYSMPLIQAIVIISSRKKNLNNYLNPKRQIQGTTYFNLSEKQKLIFGNANFYSKMAKSKKDNGMLGFVISRLSQNDEEFSKIMVPIFLKGLNNFIDIQIAITLLNYIKHYLLLNDELTEKRLKWVLGIPQLRMSAEQIGYGLAYEDQSLAFEYFSPLCFTKAEKQDLKPALTILYENHSTFNKFSASGITLLLEIMNNSEKAFHYVMSLPAPTYILTCYLDWISKYIHSFKDSFNDELRNDKQAIYEKLSEMYDSLVEKADGLNLPVNKIIIGRNKKLQIFEQAENQVFKMTLWAHYTYTLPNHPLVYSNKSLPKDLFKFANPTGFARYFVSYAKGDKVQQTDDIESQWTVYTLEIKTTEKLKLKFKLAKFNQQIYIPKGNIYINFPYQKVDSSVDFLSKIVEVSVIKQAAIVEQKEPSQEKSTAIKQQLSEYYSVDQNQMIEGIACRNCTLINGFGEMSCNACGALLYD